MQKELQESAVTGGLEEQFRKLKEVRLLDWRSPQFVGWRDNTLALLQRFLPSDSPQLCTFRNLRFRAQVGVRRLRYGYRGPTPAPVVSRDDRIRFERDCEIAAECIRGAIDTIRNFGVALRGNGDKAPAKGGSIQQYFHAPVTIHSQALATGKAVQNIGNVGGEAAGLKEIASLLQESMDLRRRELQEGIKAIDEIASEIQKPKEQRNWKSLLDCGEKLLGVLDKARDLSGKLAPYLPQVTLLIHEAGQRLHL